jgi:transcriptional regulator with XRE-family HTH domain
LGTFGERIRELRKKHGLNQKELANRIGVRAATLSRYENGKRAYHWENLVRIAEEMDTSVDYLLGRTDINVSVSRLLASNMLLRENREFFETYHKLAPQDQNLLMERAMTLYDIRSVGDPAGREQEEADIGG